MIAPAPSRTSSSRRQEPFATGENAPKVRHRPLAGSRSFPKHPFEKQGLARPDIPNRLEHVQQSKTWEGRVQVQPKTPGERMRTARHHFFETEPNTGLTAVSGGATSSPPHPNPPPQGGRESDTSVRLSLSGPLPAFLWSRPPLWGRVRVGGLHGTTRNGGHTPKIAESNDPFRKPCSTIPR
jgi:hypothetical protein